MTSRHSHRVMQWIPATRTRRLIITFNLHDADVADVNTKPICVRSGINNAHKSSVGSHRSFPFGNCFGHASYHWAVWFQQRATDTWLLTVWMRPASSATQTQRANPLAVKINSFFRMLAGAEYCIDLGHTLFIALPRRTRTRDVQRGKKTLLAAAGVPVSGAVRKKS